MWFETWLTLYLRLTPQTNMANTLPLAISSCECSVPYSEDFLQQRMDICTFLYVEDTLHNTTRLVLLEH